VVKKVIVSDLPEFDLARQLKSEADIAAYITTVIEDGDAAELAHVLESPPERAAWPKLHMLPG